MRDVEVVRLSSGPPRLALHGKAAELAAARGVTGWELTLTHYFDDGDGGRRRARREGRRDPLVTPAEMGEADARTIAAGTPESC